MNNAKPTHKDILAVIEYQAGREMKSRWTKIGVAFPSKDGSFFHLKFDFIPTDPNTRMQMRDPRPRNNGLLCDPETGEVLSETAQA